MNCKTCDVLLRYVREEDEGACDECARDEYIADNRRLANRVGELEGWLHAAADERDAFKRQYHGALADVKDQKRRADENYKSAMDYSAEAVRHMEEAERLRADVARLHAGATAVIKVLASSPDLCMSPEGLAALAMFQRGDLAGHLT